MKYIVVCLCIFCSLAAGILLASGHTGNYATYRAEHGSDALGNDLLNKVDDTVGSTVDSVQFFSNFFNPSNENGLIGRIFISLDKVSSWLKLSVNVFSDFFQDVGLFFYHGARLVYHGLTLQYGQASDDWDCIKALFEDSNGNYEDGDPYGGYIPGGDGTGGSGFPGGGDGYGGGSAGGRH